MPDTTLRRDAIVEATVRRARPVMLTALAAILAMIPLRGSAFWGPMAFVIMGGLFVATFLTLLFLPALYHALVPPEPEQRLGAAGYGTSTGTTGASRMMPTLASDSVTRRSAPVPACSMRSRWLSIPDRVVRKEACRTEASR